MNTLVSILCRKKSNYVVDLDKKLKYHNIDSVLIIDNESDSDIVRKKNFIRLNWMFDKNSQSHFTQITAWEKSFYNIYINDYINKYNYFYFLEEDVYTKNLPTIINLINYFNTFDADLISTKILPKDANAEWPWWSEDYRYIELFNDPHRSFNPLCRLSSKLISLIFDFRNHYKEFYFHEMLFSSICVQNNLSYHDYDDYPEIDEYIGTFHYRPEIDQNKIKDKKIYHPVKHFEKT